MKAHDRYTNLAELAQTLTANEIAERYGITIKAARSALTRRKLSCVPMTQEARCEIMQKVADAKPKPIARPSRIRTWSLPAQTVTYVPHTLDEQAANYLRRECPVYRCWSTGIANPKGDHWRRGSMVLTPADIIALARRKGWTG